MLLSITLTFSFCGNDKKSNTSDAALEIVEVDTQKETVTYPEPALEAEFKDVKVEAAYKQYSKLQNALVNTNAKDAAINAQEFLKTVKDLNIDGPILEAISFVATSQDVALQREQFVLITAEMEKLLAGALKSGAIYKSYCPMAFNNNGAYWLSSNKKIQNPYFGDKMLRCGRVDSEIK